MMRRAALFVCLVLAACDAGGGGGFDPGLAAVPPDTFGQGDQDIAAANLAQYDFADTGRIYGKPADAARGAAAVEFLAAQVTNGARAVNVSQMSKDQLVGARQAVRQALGIAPDANAQAVVNALLAAAGAIDTGDEAALRTALQTPVFTLLPAQTMQRLGDVPYMQPVNLATDRASAEFAALPAATCRECTQFNYTHY
jgi:hypothetical protein